VGRDRFGGPLQLSYYKRTEVKILLTNTIVDNTLSCREQHVAKREDLLEEQGVLKLSNDQYLFFMEGKIYLIQDLETVLPHKNKA